MVKLRGRLGGVFPLYQVSFVSTSPEQNSRPLVAVDGEWVVVSIGEGCFSLSAGDAHALSDRLFEAAVCVERERSASGDA
jgi:hypothetical protein